jgi:hypothetical protein
MWTNKYSRCDNRNDFEIFNGKLISYGFQSRSAVTGQRATHLSFFTVLMLRRQVLWRTPRISMLVTTTAILHFVYFLVSLLFCEKHITGHPANCHEGTEVQYISTLSLTSTIAWSRRTKPHPVRFTPSSDPVPIVWKDGMAPVSVWTGVSRPISEFDLRTAQPVTSRYASSPPPPRFDIWYIC